MLNDTNSSGGAQTRNGRPRADARGRNNLLPRYWPRITDQELQQISGDSNSVITPLFEKMLSASDAGKIVLRPIFLLFLSLKDCHSKFKMQKVQSGVFQFLF